jgi:carotenoid cleavage dioxygenase-like enzyme
VTAGSPDSGRPYHALPGYWRDEVATGQAAERRPLVPAADRFLHGSFAPVAEEITAFDLPVTGQVPAQLTGRYLRNGPNPLNLDDPNYHWFIGSGMVHGVRLRDGKAEWYRNRWVRSKDVSERLHEPWPGGPVHENFDFAANTHIIVSGGRTLATVEAGALPYELSYELDTLGSCDFGGSLPGGFAAHTKLDPRSGELHAIAYFWAWNYLQHMVIDQAGTVVRTTNIPVADGPMCHDFALTEKYVVIYNLPVTFSLDAVSAGAKMPYVWNPRHQPLVGLLPRDSRRQAGGEAGGDADGIRWIEIDPCWVFHTLNAYDDDGKVVVDLCEYPAFDVARFWSDTTPVTPSRWTIDPAAGKVRKQSLDDRTQEFPRVDERVVSRRHRYGYGVAIGEVGRAAFTMRGDFADQAFSNAIFKHDLVAGTAQVREFGRDAAVGEAVFAPSAPDCAEDDGFVLAYAHNPERGAADLVILAAQDFTGEPIARIHLPARIPLGFHGSWLPDG